jgi:hypothetical protein
MKLNTDTKRQAIENKVNQLLIEQWWRNLSPEEKEFAHEVGNIMGSFNAALLAGKPPEEALRMLMRQISDAHSKPAAKPRKGGSDRRRWN